MLRRPINEWWPIPRIFSVLPPSFYRLARSVSGASATDQFISGAGNFEQLLNQVRVIKSLTPIDAHIVNIVDRLFQYAFQQRASDILYIEPRREHGSVRFRIDGVLHTVYQFPAQVTMAVVSRLKNLGSDECCREAQTARRSSEN